MLPTSELVQSIYFVDRCYDGWNCRGSFHKWDSEYCLSTDVKWRQNQISDDDGHLRWVYFGSVAMKFAGGHSCPPLVRWRAAGNEQFDKNALLWPCLKHFCLHFANWIAPTRGNVLLDSQTSPVQTNTDRWHRVGDKLTAIRWVWFTVWVGGWVGGVYLLSHPEHTHIHLLCNTSAA